MRVMLAPKSPTGGRNRGTVTLVMGVEEHRNGALKTHRIKVGKDPVDVRGCRDPMLLAYLKGGKLIDADAYLKAQKSQSNAEAKARLMQMDPEERAEYKKAKKAQEKAEAEAQAEVEAKAKAEAEAAAKGQGAE